MPWLTEKLIPAVVPHREQTEGLAVHAAQLQAPVRWSKTMERWAECLANEHVFLLCFLSSLVLLQPIEKG